VLGFLLACGLRDVMPGGPVLEPSARDALEPGMGAALVDGQPVAYLTPPRVRFPVPALQVFGLRYDLDIVAVSDHPDFVMHELARITTTEGTRWIAKDSTVDREQCVATDIPGLYAWAAEVPVRRVASAMTVDDRSSGTEIDLSVSYTNCLGSPTRIDYRGPLPTQASRPRNGNTMGHSRRAVAALLDLFLFRAGGRIAVEIDGQRRKIVPLLGLAPQVYALAQVQGGFAVVDASMEGDETGFSLTRPGRDITWPTHAHEDWKVVEHGWLKRESPVATLLYHFVEGELDRALVTQQGEVVTEVVFSPRLPDVRRRFEGTAHSAFAVDINGQRGHGTGSVDVSWAGDDVSIDLVPTEPRWFADRPMHGTLAYEAGTAYLHMERIDVQDR